MSRRVCFVISPIGKEGTDVRIKADEFLEYLVLPAVDVFDFEVVRADKILQPSTITADIIRLVQEADICIADISGANANVFYELGRRHETGRPFIQLRSKNETGPIPFDVAGIRTVDYDLSSVAAARKSVGDLRLFVKEIIKQGFQSAAAGHTLASVGDAISRVERMLGETGNLGRQFGAGSGRANIELLQMHPQEAFIKLTEVGDLDAAFGVLDRVRKASGEESFSAGLALLASAAHYPSFSRLTTELDGIVAGNKPLHEAAFRAMVQGARSFMVNAGEIDQKIEWYISLCRKCVAETGFPNRLKAYFSNSVGMTLWRAERNAEEEEFEDIATSLNPDEPSYWYNAGLNQEKLGNKQKLRQCLDRLVDCDDLDEDHTQLIARHRSK